MRSKVAQQPGLDFSSQASIDVVPMDLGTATPAVCSRGHKIPASCVSCPICLDLESERLERELHERMVLKAASEIKDGGMEATIFAVGVAGLLHFVAAPSEKKAFCGELVNPKSIARKTFKDPYRMRGAYCRSCREFIGLNEG